MSQYFTTPAENNNQESRNSNVPVVNEYLGTEGDNWYYIREKENVYEALDLENNRELFIDGWTVGMPKKSSQDLVTGEASPIPLSHPFLEVGKKTMIRAKISPRLTLKNNYIWIIEISVEPPLARGSVLFGIGTKERIQYGPRTLCGSSVEFEITPLPKTFYHLHVHWKDNDNHFKEKTHRLPPLKLASEGCS